MGQKVNPHGIRVGVIKDWDSRWFASKKDFSDNLVEDHKIRTELKAQLKDAGVPKIEIERTVDPSTSAPMSPRDRATVPAKGIKAMCSGRLGGADIARVESYHEGTIPLQTLRADIDYGFAEAATTYGRIGVKVWVYKGEVLKSAKNAQKKEGGNK